MIRWIALLIAFTAAGVCITCLIYEKELSWLKAERSHYKEAYFRLIHMVSRLDEETRRELYKRTER